MTCVSSDFLEVTLLTSVHLQKRLSRGTKCRRLHNRPVSGQVLWQPLLTEIKGTNHSELFGRQLNTSGPVPHPLHADLVLILRGQ